MPSLVRGSYQGNKKVSLLHVDSGATFRTDAPLDNNGEGSLFSPTDLLGASLGSCILTIMAIKAEKKGFPFEGALFEVEKVMYQNPRRIGQLKIRLTLPAALTEEQRIILEKVAHACPVHDSLNPDIEVPVEFTYA